jgi:DNA-binding transcriptional regulator PaaX
MLTHPDGHPPEMARQTGYFPKTVQMTLAEMAQSGKIHSARKGREKHYRLDGAEWSLLRAQEDWPVWVSWPQWFAAMAAIWRLAQNRELAQTSVELQAAEWHKLMGRLGPWLAQSNPGMVPKDLSRLTGATYLQALQTELIRLSGLKPQ